MTAKKTTGPDWDLITAKFREFLAAYPGQPGVAAQCAEELEALLPEAPAA